MPYVSQPVEPVRARGLRHYLVPLTIVVVCGGIFAFPFAWIALGRDTDDALMVFWFMLLALPLGLLLISAWYLFFGGGRWWIRLPTLIAIWGMLPLAWFACVRSHELTTNDHGMVMRIEYRWQPTAQQKFNEFQQQTPVKEDFPAIDATVGVEDFASYRGARRDGVVPWLRLQTDWKNYPPTILWQHPVVEGYSGIAVAGNIAVTLELREGKEHVVCYDRATGRQRWVHAYDANYVDDMKMGNGPRSTPIIHDGLIFTFGALGHLHCVDVFGNPKWSINLMKEAMAKNVKWGLTGSPLIVDDLVIAHVGVDPDKNAGLALWAFDYKTGKKRWAVGNRLAGYSSPHFAVLDKVPQILVFDGEALAGFDPKTGKEFWKIPWKTKMAMNMMQPLVLGDDKVFISSETDNGCALFRLIAPGKDARNWRIESVWKNKNLGARFANPVTDGKRIFGLQNVTGVLRCLDASDGNLLWTGERYGPGQMLLVDDVLLVVSDKGVISLLRTDTENEVVAGFELFSDKTWNTPALAGDQLFVRNQTKIACLRLPRR